MKEFLICPANDCQELYFIRLTQVAATVVVADAIDQLPNWNVRAFYKDHRWMSPNMPETSCVEVMYTGNRIHPQEQVRQLNQELIKIFG